MNLKEIVCDGNVNKIKLTQNRVHQQVFAIIDMDLPDFVNYTEFERTS
jgi:hypothetical protein